MRRPFDVRRHVVAAAGNFMAGCDVASDAGEIQAFLIHVYVEIFTRMLQRTIEVAVLGAVATRTEEMAGTAVAAAGQADALRHLFQVGRLYKFARPFRKL